MPSIDIAQFRMGWMQRENGHRYITMRPINQQKTAGNPLLKVDGMSRAELSTHSTEPRQLLEGLAMLEASRCATLKQLVENSIVEKLGWYALLNATVTTVTAKDLTALVMNELGGEEHLQALMNRTLTLTVSYAETATARMGRKFRRWVSDNGSEWLTRGFRLVWRGTRKIPFGDLHEGCRTTLLRMMCRPRQGLALWRDFKKRVKISIADSIVAEAQTRAAQIEEVNPDGGNTVQPNA